MSAYHKKFSVTGWLLLTLTTLNFCSSRQERILTSDNREIADNIFIDEDTLQLSVQILADDIKEPITLKRRRLCQVAEATTEERLAELYPQTKKIAPKKKIHATLYLDEGGCQQVIRFSAPNLKKEIGKS